MGFGLNLNAFTQGALRTYAMLDEIQRRKQLDELRAAELERQQQYAQAAAQAMDNARYRTAPYSADRDSAGQDLLDPDFGLRAAYAQGGPYAADVSAPGFGLRSIVGENPQPDMGQAYQGMIRAAGAYGQPQALANTVSQYTGYLNSQQGRDDALRREAQAQQNWQAQFDANQTNVAADNRRADEQLRISQETSDLQAAEARRKESYQAMQDLGALLQQTEQAEQENPIQYAGASAGAFKQYLLQNGERLGGPLGLPQGMQVNGERLGPGQYRVDIIGPDGKSVQSRGVTIDMLKQMGASGLISPTVDKLVTTGEDPLTGKKSFAMESALRQRALAQGGVLDEQAANEADAELRKEISNEAARRNPWGPDSWRPDAMRAAYGEAGDQRAWENAEFARRKAGAGIPMAGSRPPAVAPAEPAAPAAPAAAKQLASAFVQAAQAQGATRAQALAAARRFIAAGKLLDDLK